MGVRFACHACQKPLHIKQELAGRRGVCPKCSARFRIPTIDSPTSTPLDSPDTNSATGSPQTGRSGADRPDPNRPAAPQSPTAAGDKSGGRVSARNHPAAANKIGLIANDPDASWYIRPPSGGQYGPADGDLLMQWIGEGRVAATALIWRDGWPQWREASEALAEVASTLPVVAEPTPRVGGDSTAANPSAASGASKDQNASANLAGATTVAGQAGIGAARRSRSMQRLFWIGLLSLVAIILVGVLIYLVTGSS